MSPRQAPVRGLPPRLSVPSIQALALRPRRRGAACVRRSIPAGGATVYHLRNMNNRTVRLSRPIYESLPFAYILCGVVAIVGSYFLERRLWADLLLIFGVLCAVGGTVIVLKRRDFRASRAQYSGGSLDEKKLS
jgi:hypothetical protein